MVTLFPESFGAYVSSSIIGRAIRNKKIKIKFYNPRNFTKDKWRRIDHKPYGGGPGMVIEAEAVIRAVEKAIKNTSPLAPLLDAGEGKKKR
ncbi:MAG: tRNA (guanosine(37)-N1)-methyltransferase TrmD, partial [Patescibacteria group bacterium]